MVIKSADFMLQTAQTYMLSSKLKQFSKVALSPSPPQKNLLYKKIFSTKK